MKSYTLNILWTKTGDGQPHQRQRSVSVEVPVEGDTAKIQDALLSLPGWTPDAGYSESRTVRLADPLADDLNDVGILTRAIPQARAEMEMEARKDAERKDAKLAEERVKLAAFAAGGDNPGHPLTECRSVDWLVSALHHGLGQVAIEHIVVSHGKEALEGHDELRARVDARMEEINAGARERAEAELTAKETAQTERERLNAEKEATKQERADARAVEIKAWAAEHGSERLHAQLALGLQGWPLYLHERMDADWPASVLGSVRAELDNDGETGDALVNPTVEQLALARAVAMRAAAALGLGINMDVAVEQVTIVPIEFARDEDDPDHYYGCKPIKKVYVTFSGYRPGSEVFDTKTIRFACED